VKGPAALRVTRSPRCPTGDVDVCKQTSFFYSRGELCQGQEIRTRRRRWPVQRRRRCGEGAENPTTKGARSEAAILHALVASGRTVLMPWGGSQRYDFV